MKSKLKRLILLALNACDGLPMPEAALVAAVQLALAPQEPTSADALEALKDAEAEGYVSGLTDDVLGRSWALTEKGSHKARQLR